MVIAILLITMQSMHAHAAAMDKKETIHRCLLAIYQSEKRTGEAEGEFQSLISINPNDARLHFDYGLYLSNNGDTSTALVQIRQAVKLEPQNADYWGNLGSQLRQVNDYRGAIDAYRHAIECGGSCGERRVGDFLGPDGKLLKHW